MKQNTDNQPGEAIDQQPDLHVVENPRNGNGATTLKLTSTRESRRSRPEIAVLGWNVRFYRLALRESKI